MSNSIAEALVRNRLHKRLNESDAPRDYKKQVADILNYRLGNNESYATVRSVNVIASSPEADTLRVEYDVNIRVPLYDNETGRTYYEDEVDSREQLLVLDKSSKNESLSEDTDTIDIDGMRDELIKSGRNKDEVSKMKGLDVVQAWMELGKTVQESYNTRIGSISEPEDQTVLSFLMKLQDNIEQAVDSYDKADDIDLCLEILSKVVKDSKYTYDYITSLLAGESVDEAGDLSLDDDPEETEQKYSSAATSINSSKLPALFKMVKFEQGSINLDYGGGRFDNVAEYLESEYGATNLVYDKYNRSSDHNREVLEVVRKHGGADTVTCSNVLNVIAEESERLAVLRNCKRYLKNGGTCYITVYEGSGTGEGAETKAGYQMNRKTKEYEEEISQVFSSVTRKGKLFICQ